MGNRKRERHKTKNARLASYVACLTATRAWWCYRSPSIPFLVSAWLVSGANEIYTQTSLLRSIYSWQIITSGESTRMRGYASPCCQTSSPRLYTEDQMDWQREGILRMLEEAYIALEHMQSPNPVFGLRRNGRIRDWSPVRVRSKRSILYVLHGV